MCFFFFFVVVHKGGISSSSSNSLSVSHQVIYKRFNIACPLEVFGNHSVSTEEPEESCAAEYFTINQEVRDEVQAQTQK